MKNFLKGLAAFALFMVGGFAMGAFIVGELTTVFEVEMLTSICISIIPSLVFAIWCARLVVKEL